MMKKEILSQSYSRDSFVRFATDFLPEDFAPDNANVALPSTPNFTTEIRRLGKCRSLELEVFEFRHSSMRDARVGICKDAFTTLLRQSNYNRALVAFVPSEGKQWRLSLLEMDVDINDETNRIRRTYSNPRRYSFILGVDAKVKTPTQFIIEKGRITERSENGKPLTAWDDLKSRFSVEVLTQDFYSQLYRWFLWAIDDRSGVYFPNDIYTSDDDFDRKPERIIRLITRLLFVWFIKQKGLIPEDIFRIKDLNDILRDFNPHSTTESNYYNAILQNLFFATLNQEVDKRAFINDYKNIEEKWSVKDLYRDDTRKSFFNPDYGHDRILHLFHKVPFMNSGLFDCLDTFKLNEEGKLVADMFYDGFTSNGVLDPKTKRFKRRAFIPNMLFFAPEHEENVTTNRTEGERSNLKVQGIINIFNEYNFTIEENTPSDVHVSLDPELLGRVFEELLAAYDPETGTTLRKATGSFYTPREIVDYMVEESIIAHLERLYPDYKDAIRTLVKHNEMSDDVAVTLPKDEIINSLYTIKILDPACGSGAFPMGCLLKICNIIQALDPKGYDSYQTKLRIIQNCIYGVDIQPVAMLITKLRFFISLLCEQTPDLKNPKGNFGINPLPNLDTRFVAANTLLPPDIKKFDDDKWNDERLVELRDELFHIRAKMFSSRSKSTNRKYKTEDLEKRNEIKRYICSKCSGPDAHKIDLLNRQIEQYQKELATCKDENWQDETAAQGSLFGDVPQSIFSKDLNKLKRTRLQKNIVECQHKIDQENLRALGDSFDRAITQVTQWDPFDQNMSSPFFDSEWMFDIKEGFDIVVGNPPYIEAKKLKGISSLLKDYEVSSGTADLSIYFVERGMNLCKPNGNLYYITTNKFFNTGYGKKVRRMILNYNISHIINFEQVEVFEGILVSSVILGINKTDDITNDIVFKQYYKLTNSEFRENFTGFIDDYLFYQQNALDENEWSFADDEQLDLKKSIEGSHKLLGKIEGVEIYRGVTTGYNPAFIIGDIVRDELISKDSNSSILIKKMLQGRNIRKWYYNESAEWLIQTGYDTDIPSLFPYVFEHLDKFHDEMVARSDQGVNWWNLRACRYYCEFEKPEKIIWGLTADKWAYTLDKEGHYLPSNAYILTSSIIPTKYILGILNSKVLKQYFKYIGVMTAGGAYTLKAATISSLPFVVTDEMQPIIDMVDEILTMKENDHDADVLTLENQIDRLVYQLYGLTNAEVKIIDPDAITTGDDNDLFVP